jgi:hypothetical protein
MKGTLTKTEVDPCPTTSHVDQAHGLQPCIYKSAQHAAEPDFRHQGSGREGSNIGRSLASRPAPLGLSMSVRLNCALMFQQEIQSTFTSIAACVEMRGTLKIKTSTRGPLFVVAPSSEWKQS